VGAELRQPRRVRNIGLAARKRLDVPGVDQHQLHAREVLEQVVERLPVVPGGPHHHHRDLLGDQLIS